MQYPEFRDFRRGTRARKRDHVGSHALSSEDPIQRIEDAFEEVNEVLVKELQEHIRAVSPRFERLVLDLLVRMGYGGGLRSRGGRWSQRGRRDRRADQWRQAGP